MSKYLCDLVYLVSVPLHLTHSDVQPISIRASGTCCTQAFFALRRANEYSESLSNNAYVLASTNWYVRSLAYDPHEFDRETNVSIFERQGMRKLELSTPRESWVPQT